MQRPARVQQQLRIRGRFSGGHADGAPGDRVSTVGPRSPTTRLASHSVTSGHHPTGVKGTCERGEPPTSRTLAGRLGGGARRELIPYDPSCHGAVPHERRDRAGSVQAATSGRVALEASNPSRANFPLCGHCTLAHGSAPECGCYGWPAGGASRARARLHDDERSTRCVSRTRYMSPSPPTLSSKLSLRAHICIAALMLVSVMYVR